METLSYQLAAQGMKKGAAMRKTNTIFTKTDVIKSDFGCSDMAIPPFGKEIIACHFLKVNIFFLFFNNYLLLFNIIRTYVRKIGKKQNKCLIFIPRYDIIKPKKFIITYHSREAYL